SWTDFLNQRSVTPNATGANSDLIAFYAAYSDKYFATCRDGVKASAPKHLYLGARFTNNTYADASRAASKYCDVLSINCYATLPKVLGGMEADVPIIASEFHMGANDTGLWGKANVVATDQA